MAGDLPFLDSFDHYLTAQGVQKWTSGVSVVAAAGRRGTAGAHANSNTPISRTFDNEYETLYCGGAFYGIGNGSPLGVSNALSGISVAMKNLGDGRFVMQANGVQGSAVSPPVLDSAWYYLEMKATVVAVSGSVTISVEFRVNELVVLTDSYTYAHTGVLAHAKWASFTIRGKSGGLDTSVDDVYVDDEAYFGDINIDVIRPNGTGGGATWVPTSGANWTNTDEITPDDDTTIVSSAFVNDEDTYAMQDIPAGLTAVALQGLVSVKKSTAGLAAMKLKYVSSGGTVLTAEFFPSESSYWFARDGRKSVAGALTSALVNSIQFGQKRTQ